MARAERAIRCLRLRESRHAVRGINPAGIDVPPPIAFNEGSDVARTMTARACWPVRIGRKRCRSVSSNGLDARSAMTSFNLKDKTALVTGGSSDIGAAVAELFRDLGATVCIADIKGDDGKLSLQGRRIVGRRCWPHDG